VRVLDLRTEDSGKLGCRLIGEPKDQEVEQLEDFAVTGIRAALIFWHRPIGKAEVCGDFCQVTTLICIGFIRA